jgi:hypothetical protein
MPSLLQCLLVAVAQSLLTPPLTKCLGNAFKRCRPYVLHCNATQPCPTLPPPYQPYTCKSRGCYQGNFPSCIAGEWQCT